MKMGVAMYWWSGVLLAACSAARPAPPAAHFASRVTVHTPATSYSHGVGDPAPAPRRPRPQSHALAAAAARSSKVLSPPPFRLPQFGYPRTRPPLPFYQEDIPHDNALLRSSWRSSDFIKVNAIPVLPASPYHVNSANPESLWPEGLFLPPAIPFRGFLGQGFTSKSDQTHSAHDSSADPYLLTDEEALQALDSITHHGELFFHDIPHKQSLMENQQLRIQNGLPPFRLGSIRHTFPAYRH